METPPAGPLRRLREGALTHTATLLAAQLSAALLGFGFWMLASRRYGYAQLGSDAAVISMAVLVSLFAKLGLDTFLATHLGRDPRASRWARRAIGLSALCALALAALLMLLPSGDPVRWLCGVALAVALTVGIVVDGALIGQGRSGAVLGRALVVGLVRIGVLYAAAPLWPDATLAGASWILLAWTLSGFAVALFAWRTLKELPAAEALDPAEARGLVRAGTLNSLAATLVSAPGLLFPLLLARHGLLELAGVFYFVWMIVALFYMVPTSMGYALLREPSESDPRHRHALLASVGLVLAGLALLALVGAPALRLLGGAPLLEARDATLALAATAVVGCGNHYYMSRLRRAARWKALTLAALVSALLALSLAWVLIPRAGLWAVVAAWSAGQVSCFLLAATLARRRA